MLQRLQNAQDIHQVLLVGMHDLMSLLGAERGNIQLFGRASELVVVAQYGLTARFLGAFRRVSAESTSVCGRAAAARAVVFVPDVSDDATFVEHLPVARGEGITSILSCPLTTLAGDCIGMVSAHFAARANPTPLELAAVAQYGEALGQAVDHFLPRQGRVESVERMADDLVERTCARCRSDPPVAVKSRQGARPEDC